MITLIQDNLYLLIGCVAVGGLGAVFLIQGITRIASVRGFRASQMTPCAAAAPGAVVLIAGQAARDGLVLSPVTQTPCITGRADIEQFVTAGAKTGQWRTVRSLSAIAGSEFSIRDDTGSITVPIGGTELPFTTRQFGSEYRDPSPEFRLFVNQQGILWYDEEGGPAMTPTHAELSPQQVLLNTASALCDAAPNRNSGAHIPKPNPLRASIRITEYVFAPGRVLARGYVEANRSLRARAMVSRLDLSDTRRAMTRSAVSGMALGAGMIAVAGLVVWLTFRT